MKDKNYQIVFDWFQNKNGSIIADLGELVNIPSVAVLQGEKDEYDLAKDAIKKSDDIPYGKSCRDALDCILKKAEEYGFSCRNYANHVGSVEIPIHGEKKHIGLWAHLDVVPPGEGWDSSPFEMIQKDGFVIGRGVQDNKSAAVGLLYVLMALKQLNLVVNHQYTAYFGCAEEIGMYDLKYMKKYEKLPDLSIVADCGFPVCYGESGILTMELQSVDDIPPQIADCICGNSKNTVPDYAKIVLKDEKVDIEAFGKAVHVSVSEQGENAWYQLMHRIEGLKVFQEFKPFHFYKYLEEKENLLLMFEKRDGMQVNGGITTAKVIEKKICINLDLRYPILEGNGKVADGQKLEAYIKKKAAECGMKIVSCSNQKPCYFDPERKEVKVLESAFQRFGGYQTKNYCMSGGTYARQLKEAFAFGIALPGKKICSSVSCGGDYHQPNESLNIEEYLRGLALMTICIAEFDRTII